MKDYIAPIALAAVMTVAVLSYSSLFDPAADVRQSTVRITQGTAIGSGVIISPTAILTAGHVVDGAAPVTVWFTGLSDPVPATIAWVGREIDLALITVAALPEGIVPAEIDCSTPVLDEPIIVVGNPIGLSNIVAHGHISTDAVDVDGDLAIDALINPGNSGGPAFGEDGRVRAIVTLINAADSGPGVPMGVPSPVICQHLGLE